ncbi:IS110 family transposase [Brevibacterium linens]|uniref:IS110 family transposase n=1 Tax=Brevibacterium linens TaxID=1703 RepID=UPI0013DF9811|nr:IS110 family transposase [Brevibacterium linens]
MITNHADIDVFIGIDVGKHNHYAVAVDRDGKLAPSACWKRESTQSVAGFRVSGSTQS